MVLKLAAQYLEPNASILNLVPADVSARLRSASALLPLSLILLGWDLPEALISACAEETRHTGAELYLWYPLLTGSQTRVPPPEWQTIGLNAAPVAGFAGMPEFTFVCPNRPEVREAVLEHLNQAIQRGDYQGVFLDRIRYPSPASDPAISLACFCVDCGRAAAAIGLDLERARHEISRLVDAPERVWLFVQMLLGMPLGTPLAPELAVLQEFLAFRAQSVTRIVREAADLVHAAGLSVGLDCFSPALTGMVGQDLGGLAGHCEWIKIMTYCHAFGPAGIPFEMLGLADWLIERHRFDEVETLEGLSQATGLPLPSTRARLYEQGLASRALTAEVERGLLSGTRGLYAGIELVELEGVTRLNPTQILADLQAVRATKADGLVLSWDLWHIPLERLELVRRTLEMRD